MAKLCTFGKLPRNALYRGIAEIIWAPRRLWREPSDLVFRVQAVGYEHMPGTVRDHQGGFGLLGRCLGSHTAGPEHRCLIFRDRDGIAKVRALQIAYA